jgi:uncharacterized protein YktB (UPF0637 family)
MISLKVKIESNGNTFNFRHELPDGFVISKDNPEMQRLVQKDCDDSHLEEIEDVSVYAKFVW